MSERCWTHHCVTFDQRRVPRRMVLLLPPERGVRAVRLCAVVLRAAFLRDWPVLRRGFAGRFFSRGSASRHSVAVCPMFCTGIATTASQRDASCCLRAAAESPASFILTN